MVEEYPTPGPEPVLQSWAAWIGSGRQAGPVGWGSAALERRRSAPGQSDLVSLLASEPLEELSPFGFDSELAGLAFFSASAPLV